MSTKNFKPFENETDSQKIGDLTIENRIDRVSFFGSLDVTRDKHGLKDALALRDLITQAIEVLNRENLPERVPITPAEDVPNPFRK